MDIDRDVTIRLSRAEAIVLFELIARINDDPGGIAFEDEAERIALWGLENTLESTLPEPFLHEYPNVVQEARNEIRKKGV